MRASSSSSVVSRFEPGVAPVDVVGAVIDQPVAHRHRGAHVVLVVAGDPVEAGLILVLHPVLVLDDGAGATVDVVAALVVGEALDVLQAVRLDTDLHRAGHDREQVDEQPGGDLTLEFQLGDAVVGGEAHQRGPLGVVVVVHVHVREPAATLGQVLDEVLRGLRLLRLVVRPERLEHPLAGVVAFDEAEQEEQPDVGLPERVPLEVEEHVAVVGRRQRGEPGQLRFDRLDVEFGEVGSGGSRTFEQLERWWGSLGRLACLDLEGGLADHPFETRLVEIVDRTIEGGEPGDRRDAVRVQHRPVGAANTGDVHERVGGPPLGVAHQLELAEPAVIARLRRPSPRSAGRRRATRAGCAGDASRR